MEFSYSRYYYLRATDFDTNERLTPRAILEIFQDIAGSHAEKTGMGFAELFSKNLIWIIARTKFTVEKQIARYSTVKVKTWPLTPQRLIFRREYLIYDDTGDIAVRGSSDWMILNRETNSLASSTGIFPENAEYLNETALDERLRKIKAVEGDASVSQVTPQFTDIDLNGHVNNTRYADFSINALPRDGRLIKSFQIDYHNETLIDEPLKLACVINDNKAVINGEGSNGEKKFTCEIVFA